MIKEKIGKLVDYALYGSEKDRRIRELQNALTHLVSTVDTFGPMHLYQANPEWEPPAYLRNGEYTMDKRLEDIRWRSERITEASEEAKKALFRMTETGLES